MRETGYGKEFDKEYDSLPESIKAIVSPKEYAWTNPELRSKLIEQECYPDVEE